MGKQTRCSQCSAQADLHTDPADGKVYCTICWEQYYGKGTAPSKPSTGRSLAGWLPPELAAEEKGAGISTSTPTSTPPPPPSATATAAPLLAYTVNGNRKGGIPVGIEKRAKGKKVTVVSNIQGDAEALLSHLQKAVGCGGVVNPGEVVLQGECVAKVEAFLLKAGCLKGVSHAKLATFSGSAGARAAGGNAVAGGSGGGGSGSSSGTTDLELPLLDLVEVKKMKPPDMKKLLKAHGLSIQGNKKDLLARMTLAFCSNLAL